MTGLRDLLDAMLMGRWPGLLLAAYTGGLVAYPLEHGGGDDQEGGAGEQRRGVWGGGEVREEFMELVPRSGRDALGKGPRWESGKLCGRLLLRCHPDVVVKVLRFDQPQLSARLLGVHPVRHAVRGRSDSFFHRRAVVGPVLV